MERVWCHCCVIRAEISRRPSLLRSRCLGAKNIPFAPTAGATPHGAIVATQALSFTTSRTIRRNCITWRRIRNMNRRSRRCEKCCTAIIRPPRPARKLPIVLLLALAIGCASKKEPPPTAVPETGVVAILPDKHSFFIAGTTERLIPWGFNYDRDFMSRLLEDYWE